MYRGDFRDGVMETRTRYTAVGARKKWSFLLRTEVEGGVSKAPLERPSLCNCV